MQFIKKSERKKPKVSLILLDWSVRESFHICDYLNEQTVPRDDFEVIVFEYYSSHSQIIQKHVDEIDTWVLLEMPTSTYYHKHLMYNIGALLSHGEILVICDSDAMVKPTFIESIISHFENQPNSVLHLDQFRNSLREFYPFNYPSFEEVTGKGCFNKQGTVTVGILENTDLLHKRNYGSCFCCLRKDYFDIGGADEHIDYVGHVCGPYDLTFRLINSGKEEVWHEKEFLYHTWHPGTNGKDNYLGPHDGQNMSTISLISFFVDSSKPHVINPAIQKLQRSETLSEEDLLACAISKENRIITEKSFLAKRKKVSAWAAKTYAFKVYKNIVVVQKEGVYSAYLLKQWYKNKQHISSQPLFSTPHFNEMRRFLKKKAPVKFLFIKQLVFLSFQILFNYFRSFVTNLLYKIKKIRENLLLFHSKTRYRQTLTSLKPTWKPLIEKIMKEKKKTIVLFNKPSELFLFHELLATQGCAQTHIDRYIKTSLFKDLPLEDPDKLSRIFRFGALYASKDAYLALTKKPELTKIKATVI